MEGGAQIAPPLNYIDAPRRVHETSGVGGSEPRAKLCGIVCRRTKSDRRAPAPYARGAPAVFDGHAGLRGPSAARPAHRLIDARLPTRCRGRDTPNLQRLAAALTELRARIRTEGVEGGLSFSCDAKFLSAVDILNLETDAGDLDLTFFPSGTTGYDDLAEHQQRFDLGGVVVPTASLEDIIRSKAAADRPKDRDALPVLRELARQIAARRSPPPR